MDRAPTAGFVLPWAMFTLTLVALLAATGFLLTWLDGRSARAFSRSTKAFYLAEGGLATAIVTAAGPTPTLAPISFAGGSATTTFEQVLELGPGERLFSIESTGRVPSGGASYERGVRQLAWVAAAPTTPGALVLVGGASAIGTTGRISGFDSSGGCPASATPVAGVAYWGGPAPASGGGLTVSGFPAVQSIPGSSSIARETGIRWTELTAPFGPVPDAVVPPGPWPGAAVAGGWPVIRVVGSATLGVGNSGRGTLLVDRDLSLAAGFDWEGVILVGGRLRLTGSVRLRGAVMVGLSGGGGLVADLAGQSIDLEYDACAVARAAARLTARAAAIPGTWSEVW